MEQADLYLQLSIVIFFLLFLGAFVAILIKLFRKMTR